MPLIEQVRAERGFGLIIRKHESGVISAGSHVDVTQQVIDRMR
jgi:hypothetical protein